MGSPSREPAARPGPLALRPLTRLGGAAVSAGGLVTVAAVASRATGTTAVVALAWGLVLAAAGLVAALLDWRPRRRWVVVLPLLAWAALGVDGVLDGATVPGASAATVAVACWAGLTLPGRQVALTAPWVAASGLVPALATGGPLPWATTAAVTALSMLVSGCLAGLVGRLRRAEAADQASADALEELVQASLELVASRSVRGAGEAVVRCAARLTGAADVVFVVAGPGREGGTGDREVARRTLSPAVPGGLPEGAALTVRGGGLLLLDVPADRLDPFTRDCLRTLCAQAGLVLERLRAAATLEASLDTDPLTGVGNRRHLDSALADLAPDDLVVVLDLDHFKTVNDTWGHDAGDRVLVALARHLEASVRERDVVARLGGEEFVVVLRGAGRDLERAAATLVRTGVGWARRPPADRGGVPTTFSAGAARHDGGDPRRTLKAADTALYDAKAAGRDAAVIEGLEGAVVLSRTGPQDGGADAVEAAVPGQRRPGAVRAGS